MRGDSPDETTSTAPEALPVSPHDASSPTEAGIGDAVRDARVESALALLVAIGLLAVNGALSRREGWHFAVPWWMWLMLALPEVALLSALVVSALGGVRPGRHRDVVLALLASLVTTGILMWALGTADVTGGQALLGALVVWSTNLIGCALLFWELDGGGPLRRATEGRRFPDFQFPQEGPSRWRQDRLADRAPDPPG
jgi:hypothetical protein